MHGSHVLQVELHFQVGESIGVHIQPLHLHPLHFILTAFQPLLLLGNVIHSQSGQDVCQPLVFVYVHFVLLILQFLVEPYNVCLLLWCHVLLTLL